MAPRTVGVDRKSEPDAGSPGASRVAAPCAPPGGLGNRVLALQRTAGNAAVVRALGLGGARTLARDPDPAPASAPWSFSPFKPGAEPPAIDLRPWESRDPAKRQKAQDDLLWAASRPKAVTVTVTASGLKDATKTVVAAPPAPSNADAPTTAPASGGGPAGASTDPAQTPQTVPVANTNPPVKGVQIQVAWGLAAERHTSPVGPGAGKDDSPSSDWQSSAQVALTVVYHDDDKPGWEWSTQFQVNWSDTSVLRAMSPTSLQNIQIGSQLAYVLPLWKNVQWQIFGQIMMGVGPDGKPVAQASVGGQFQWKLGKGFSLFLQGNVGGTENSGAGNRPSYTGDESVQGGVMYSW